MPPSGEEDHALRRDLLTFEETARLVSVFASAGVQRVRFTGGEPLVRKDIVRLVELVSRRTAVEKLVMTTNATRLDELAQPLEAAGLHGVNISLDTLDADRFARGGVAVSSVGVFGCACSDAGSNSARATTTTE